MSESGIPPAKRRKWDDDDDDDHAEDPRRKKKKEKKKTVEAKEVRETVTRPADAAPTSKMEAHVAPEPVAPTTSSTQGGAAHGADAAPLPPQIAPYVGCRSVDCFERMNRIEEGAYGVVYRAKDKETGEVVALKKVKMDKEREGFPMTSLREVNILLSCKHPNIVEVKEVAVGSNMNSIFMVMEYMEHDLKSLLEDMKQPYLASEVKCLMKQLLSALDHLHDNWILHRDLKTSNLLLNNQGVLKVADFGLARAYGDPIKPYTPVVVTLWYRAPELLLGTKTYSTAVDMWAAGCIFAELLLKQPLIAGQSEIDQLDKIFRLMGTPTAKLWPGLNDLPHAKKLLNFKYQPYNNLRKKFPPPPQGFLTEAGFDLLNKFLVYDPEKRISAAEALNHPYFSESPLPKSADMMPTYPSTHEGQRRKRNEIEELLEQEQRRILEDNDEARFEIR